MKNINQIVKSGGIFLFAVLLILSGCNSAFNPISPKKQAIPAGKGLVNVSIAGSDSRTVFPAMDNFKFAYEFTGDSKTPVTGVMDNKGLSEMLTAGLWTLNIKAYSNYDGNLTLDPSDLAASDDYLAGEALGIEVEVKDQGINNVSVTIVPVGTEEGFLVWNFAIPENMDGGLLTVTKTGASDSIVSESDISSIEAILANPLPLSPGSYLVMLSLEGETGTDAEGTAPGFTEAVHIYPKVNTTLTYDFNAGSGIQEFGIVFEDETNLIWTIRGSDWDTIKNTSDGTLRIYFDGESDGDIGKLQDDSTLTIRMATGTEGDLWYQDFTVSSILETGSWVGNGFLRITIYNTGVTPVKAKLIPVQPGTVTITDGYLGETGTALSGDYMKGETVPIRAGDAPDGFIFAHWEITPQVTFTAGDINNPEAAFTMPGEDVTVTAIFVNENATFYTVTVSGGDGGGSFPDGTNVSVTADPELFISWTIEGIDGVSTSIENPFNFTMPANDVSITATNKLVIYPGPNTSKAEIYGDAWNTVLANPGGTLQVFGQGWGGFRLQWDDNFTYDSVPSESWCFDFAVAEVIASKNDGLVAEGWGNQVVRILLVPGNNYPVKIDGGFITGTADTKALYEPGANVSVTSDVPIGQLFENWDIAGLDGTTTSSAVPFTFIMPPNMVTLTAVCVPDMEYLLGALAGTWIVSETDYITISGDAQFMLIAPEKKSIEGTINDVTNDTITVSVTKYSDDGGASWIDTAETVTFDYTLNNDTLTLETTTPGVVLANPGDGNIMRWIADNDYVFRFYAGVESGADYTLRVWGKNGKNDIGVWSDVSPTYDAFESPDADSPNAGGSMLADNNAWMPGPDNSTSAPTERWGKLDLGFTTISDAPILITLRTYGNQLSWTPRLEVGLIELFRGKGADIDESVNLLENPFMLTGLADPYNAFWQQMYEIDPGKEGKVLDISDTSALLTYGPYTKE